MAKKCTVDSSALEMLQSQTYELAMEMLEAEYPIDIVKTKVSDFVVSLNKRLAISDKNIMNSVTSVVYNTLDDFGIVNSDPDFFNQNMFNQIIEIEQKQISMNNDTTDASSNKIFNSEEAHTRYDATTQFLDDAYGLAKSVRTAMMLDADAHLFDALFVNRGLLQDLSHLSRGVVKEADLNNNIRKYHEVLLGKIVDYLRNTVDTIEAKGRITFDDETKRLLANPKMYEFSSETGEFFNTNILEKLDGLIQKYINFDSDDKLRNAYILSKSRGDSNEKEDAKARIDAFNANVLLRHFDTYVTLRLDGVIDINSDFNVRSGKNKYSISKKTAQLVTTWRATDEIIVADEVDKVTKFAISTTPYYNVDGTEIPNRFLHFSDFEHMIAKIKQLSYNEDVMRVVFDKNWQLNNKGIWKALSDTTKAFLNGKSLAQAINYIRKNPRENLAAVFEILANTDFMSAHSSTFFSNDNFTRDEKNKLYSLSKGIFSSKSENSIFYLTHGSPDLDYYNFISQTADSIFKINYIQYFRDEDGVIKIRNLVDQSISNIRKGIENNIISINSINLINNFQQFANSVDMKYDSETRVFRYKLPHSEGSPAIEIKYDLGTGTIEYYDLATNAKLDRSLTILWDDPKVKEYISSILGINFNEDVDYVQSLYDVIGSYNGIANALLRFVTRINANKYISHKFIKNASEQDRDALISSYYGQNPPTYNNLLKELNVISKSDVDIIYQLAIAKANLFGVTTSAQLKDGEGNGQSSQSLSRLLGSLRSQWDLQEAEKDQFDAQGNLIKRGSVTQDALILTVPGLYEGIYTAKEYYTRADGSTQTTDMSVSEMMYAGFVYDFMGGLMPKDAKSNPFLKEGHVLFLPSVNSDKNTIGRIMINLNKKVMTESGEEKMLRDLSGNELKTLISKELGTIYARMYQSLQDDWKIVDSIVASYGLPFLSQDILFNFANFNQAFQNNQALVQTYKNPIDFIKAKVLEYNKKNRKNPVELIDQVHFKSAKFNGQKNYLSANQILLGQLVRYSPTFIDNQVYLYNRSNNTNAVFDFSKYKTSEQFWALKNAEILKSALKARFRVNTVQVESKNPLEDSKISKQPEIDFLRGELLKIQSENPELGKWINHSGDMVLAKFRTADGKLVDITGNRDLQLLKELRGVNEISDLINILSNEGEFILNPLLEKQNYLSFLFSQEFMISTVGSFLAHPEKSGSLDPLIQEAASFQAQHKRNVSYTAAMHAFLLNSLNGISEDYNIAVIDDITDKQSSIFGRTSKIKPFDGATFVNPFIVYLENNSLCGARAGITKKQFIHFKNAKTGTGGIIKTAGFGLTNDWIRNSDFLQKMMEKMSNHIWTDENGNPIDVDITHSGLTNSKIDYTYITKEGKPGDFLYFRGDDGYFYRINSFEKVKGEQNTYTRTIQRVNNDGSPILNMIKTEEKVVDSNYKLWDFFGGMNSMELEGDHLKLSEASIEAVVKAMNNVGYAINGATNIETQEQFYQPLKHSDVHYVVTAGAIKQGAANINSASRYTDNEAYDIQKIKMYQSGIQLDKEHHADDSELSLMTQVVSACAAKGYTLEAAIGLYNALSKATEQNTSDHINALKEFFTTNDKTSLKAILNKTIINALATSSSQDNFATAIASDLIRQAREGKEINYAEDVDLPLSDNTVYAKILSIISSYLTKTGIKQTVPGILSVLTPSYNIFKVWGNQKYEHYLKPSEDLAQKQAEQKPIFDINVPNSNLSKLEIGRNYFIHRIDPTTGQTISNESEFIQTPKQYYILKNEVVKGQIASITEDVTKGRDLAAYNKRGRTTSGEEFQLLDLDSARDLFLYTDIMENEDLDEVTRSMKLTKLFQRALPGIPIQLNRFETLLRRKLQQDLLNLSKSTPKISNQYKTLLDSFARFEDKSMFYNNYARWVNIYKGTGLGEKVEVQIPLNSLIVTNNPAITPQVAMQMGGIDVLRHPGPDGMHFGNPFSHNAYPGVQVVLDSVKDATIAYEQWLRGQKYQEIEPERRQWIINQIRSGNLDGKPIIYYTDKVPDDSYGRATYDYLEAPNHAHILQKLILENSDYSNSKQILVKPNEKNFRQVESSIRKTLVDSTKVKINGKLQSIDLNSLETQPYELIMPKVFAKKFGLREFDSVEEIVNDKDFFIKRYIDNQKTKLNVKQYDVKLGRANGEHVYLLSKRNAVNAPNITKVPNSQILIEYIDGEKYRLDPKDKSKKYKITDDFELYTTTIGNEVIEIIVTDKINEYVENVAFDTLRLSPMLENNESLAKSLLNDFKESSKNQVRSFYNYVTNRGRNKSKLKQIFERNRDYHNVTLANYMNLPENHPVIRAGRIKHASFMKALDVIAARIPAQSMQSFMAMKVVAFDNPDINTAYVSTMQILLQGSDFDIDAVSLALYDVDENGNIPLWSPYADGSTLELLNDSFTLPIPTGKKIESFNENSNENAYLETADTIEKFADILLISKSEEEGANANDVRIDLRSSVRKVNLQTGERTITSKISKISQLINELPLFKVPPKDQYEQLASELNKRGLTKEFTADHMESLFAELAKIVNRHNQYFSKQDKNKLSRIVNNYTMCSMYSVINDAANLIQAQTPVDATTGPLKDKSQSNVSEARELANRTAGNINNLYESINDNQVGKKGISICATGLKAFFGATQYCNYLLNYGDATSQARLLLGRPDAQGNYQGIRINSNRKVYRTLANIRSKDINTIQNKALFDALSEVDNDTDAALILSALLSLATDNAKELALAKLNAGTKTLGLYVYGISIGMKFDEIADIMMSKVGRTISEVLDSDMFNDDKGIFSVGEQLFNYFKRGPLNKVKEIDRKYGTNIGYALSQIIQKDEIIKPPYDRKYYKPKKGYDPLQIELFATIMKGDASLEEKLNYVNQLRNAIVSQQQSDYTKMVANQIMDTLEDFAYKCHTISRNRAVYKDIQTLADGAAEMRILGQILGLNKGLKTKSNEINTQINLIERAIYDHTEDEKDLIDLTRFAVDEDYRKECIDKYERLAKHSFNILDIAATVPHFMGYIQTLAVSAEEMNRSFKFRSTRKLSLSLSKRLNYTREDKMTTGIQNFLGDFMRKNWMLDSPKEFQTWIPKGNKIYDRFGNETVSDSDTKIQLGTDWGDATFRVWMENEVIPNLKKGIIKPNTTFEAIQNNKFISDLTNNIVTTTVSRNPTIVYTLPINMLPRQDFEESLFDSYKAAFNELIKYNYEYNLTKTRKVRNSEDYVTKQTPETIPLLDLFTYYAMIGHGWKLGEKSLVSILKDLQDRGKIKQFRDFIKKLDESDVTLDLSNISIEDIAPYVAPFENPYASQAVYIWNKDPDTKQNVLLVNIKSGLQDSAQQFMDGQNLEPIQNSDGSQTTYHALSTLGKFKILPKVNTNIFTKGHIDNSIKTLVYQVHSPTYGADVQVYVGYNVEEDNKISHVAIKIFNPTRKKWMTSLTMDSSQDSFPKKGFKVRMRSSNDVETVDVQHLQDLIEHQINKCKS